MDDRYLFKAKRADNGEWVTGYYTKSIVNGSVFGYIRESIFGTDIKIMLNTLCQYTGLKDKNGNLIWENDIVKKEFYTDYDNCANSEEYIGIVKITDCAWVIETIRDKCTRPIFETMSYSEDVKHFEIIGNVFDNPELLEGGE